MFSFLLEHRVLFMLLSLSSVLHGGAFFLYDGDGTTVMMTSSKTPISLTLVQPAPAAVNTDASPAKHIITKADSTTRKQPVTRPRTTPKADNRPVLVERHKQTENLISKPVIAAQFSTSVHAAAQPPQDITKPLAETITQPPTNPVQHAVPVHSQLQAALQSRLRFNHHYPRSAIRRGWQGRVELAVQINPQGQIAMIRVLQSSGHHVLDQAAIHSIEGLASLPEAIALLDLQPVELTIPVIYRLE